MIPIIHEEMKYYLRNLAILNFNKKQNKSNNENILSIY